MEGERRLSQAFFKRIIRRLYDLNEFPVLSTSSAGSIKMALAGLPLPWRAPQRHRALSPGVTLPNLVCSSN